MIFLTVPFAEKDQAKALGARWNAAQKKWYVPDGADRTLFEKWQPQEAATHNGASNSENKNNGPAKGASMMEIGLTITGEKYFALDHNCIPWDPCADCDATVSRLRANLSVK